MSNFAKSPAFPTTRHLLFLVAYSAGLCTLLAPLGRRHNAFDFYFLSTLLILGAPALVNVMVWLIEEPDDRRGRHLLLGVVLARLSRATVAIGTAAAIWAFTWTDFPFFIRIEGRHWLLYWVAIPCWLIAACRLVLGGRHRRASDDRVSGFVLATLLLIVAIGYRRIAPMLTDRDLTHLSKGLLTLALFGVLSPMVPGRCPGCFRRSLIRLPGRPPFVPHASPYRIRRCVACGIEIRDPRSPSP